MKEKVLIFDSTLRDGEQTPGAKLNAREKMEIARQLARLKVDIIEAGFPVSSPGEFKAVQAIAREIRGPVITALSRIVKEDIDIAWESVKDAENPRIHVFLASSDIHMKYKLRKSPEELLEQAVEAVRYAKNYTADIQYSLEDATRSHKEYIYQVVEAVIKAGATTVNIPDTVGYAMPDEFSQLIRDIFENVPNIHKAVLSVHCHDDLGLAVVNSLKAVENGARQVECNINGIGERAGNASLEEIVVAMRVRQDYFSQYEVGLNLKEIYKTSRLVSGLTGIPIPVNKAIIGTNAFAHSSGIHQDGIIKNKDTYEIINAELIGGQAARMMLTARSGRHAVHYQLDEMGYSLPKDKFEDFYSQFLDLADRKKEVYHEDLEALIADQIALDYVPTFKLEYLQTVSGTKSIPAAVVKLQRKDQVLQEVASGSGPIEAAFNAIDKITGLSLRLDSFNIRAVTEGREALGEASLKINYQGKVIIGRGTSTDIVEASVKAYLNGINKLILKNGNGSPLAETEEKPGQ